MLKKLVNINFMKRSSRYISGGGQHIGDPFVWDFNSHWRDIFGIDSLLSEDERMIRYEFVYLECSDWFRIVMLQEALRGPS